MVPPPWAQGGDARVNRQGNGAGGLAWGTGVDLTGSPARDTGADLTGSPARDTSADLTGSPARDTSADLTGSLAGDTGDGRTTGDPPGDWVHRALVDLLADARDQHFLGPGDVEAHISHSLAFARLVPEPLVRAVDLGSGAGIPGLVLALHWPESEWALLDANERRTGFLREAVGSLGLGRRVHVLTQRAEIVGRAAPWRSAADLVVARGFGAPAVTAECAAPLLRPGGTLVVAEPPGGAPGRWPPAALGILGLAVGELIVQPVALQSLRQVSLCPDRFPRRVGVPAKRPLF